MSAEETRDLVVEVPRTYKTQINDALMFALVKAICSWTGGNSALIELEGHGREAILDGIDASRTVGWFTTLYPVWLQLPAAGEMRGQIQSIHAALQRIPHHGMGFGILRYLSENRETSAAMERLPRAEISFLYMGQFDQAFSSDSLFAPALESVGSAHDPDGERCHLLEINSLIRQGRLQMSWTYSRNRHRQQTIRSLAREYMNELRALIASCRDTDAGDDVQSRFKGSGISESDLAEIRRQVAIQAKGAM